MALLGILSDANPLFLLPLFLFFPLVPNLKELMSLNIIAKVSSQWKDIGIRTGQADKLHNYERRAIHGDQECCVRVFEAWIINGGSPPKYPMTWQGLYYLLCDVGRRGTANELADKKGLRKGSDHLQDHPQDLGKLNYINHSARPHPPHSVQRDSVKAGLRALDWTMDCTMDWNTSF